MTTATLPLTLDELHDLAGACTCAATLWLDRSIAASKDPANAEYSPEYAKQRVDEYDELRDRVHEVIDSLS